MVNCWFNFTH